MSRGRSLIKSIIFMVFLLEVIFFLNLPENNNYNIENQAVDKSFSNDPILHLTIDAGQEYIDKIYFVGDSTTYHFFKGGIDKTHILVPESLTMTLTSNIDNVIVGNDGLTIATALKEVRCEIVIITLGANRADSFTETKYKTYYGKLINTIKKESPDTKIIIQSVFPVTESYSEKDLGITNKGIDRINEWAKELAIDENLRYLDTQSILKNENGAQMECYSEKDGVHLNAEAYRAIVHYIRTHAIGFEEEI